MYEFGRLLTGALERRLSGGTLPTSDMAISPDGETLATACEDSNLRFWDVGKQSNFNVLKAHGEWVEAVAYCKGRNLIASGGWDHCIKIWDGETLTKVFEYENLPFNIHELAFSADGKLLAVAGWSLATNNQASVVVYDVESKKGLAQTLSRL